VNCTVTGNRAASGGGIYGGGTLINSVVSNNVAQFSGGGVYGGTALTDSTISGNSAQAGGAIYGGASVTRSTISGNTATTGVAGIYSVSFINGSNISVLNSTISGNIGPGGAIFVSVSSGFSWVIDSTIVGNTSGVAESTDMNASMAVKNTILANNGPNCAGFVDSADYKLSSDTSCTLTKPHDRQGINPQIGPLADNTGPTKTHALLPGSPAIDSASCVNDSRGDPITTDQRGIARPQGTACDIGAYEYAPIHASPPSRSGPPQNSHPIPMPVTRTPPSGGSSGATPNPLPPHR